MNGIQHYKIKWKSRSEPENDAKKKEYAYTRGFNDDTYLIIDCHESNKHYLTQNSRNILIYLLLILNSVLNLLHRILPKLLVSTGIAD